MFPKLDKEIIESVYETHNGDADATISALLELSGEKVEQKAGSSNPQLLQDEEYARRLQEKELRQLEPTERVEEPTPLADELEAIGESVKKSFQTFGQSFKSFVGKISNQFAPEATTPRTEYNNLPNHEFNKFLDDDEIVPVSPARNSKEDQIKRDEELARQLQYS